MGGGLPLDSGGYVRLHRCFLDHPIYRDCSGHVRDVMLLCLLKANWKEGRWFNAHRQEIVPVGRGQWATSVEKIRELCPKWTSTRQVRTALDTLKKLGFLDTQADKGFTLITVCNYDKWTPPTDDTDKQVDETPTSHRQATDKTPTTIEEGKEVKALQEGEEATTSSSTSPAKLTIPVEEIRSYWNSKGVLPTLRHVQGTRLTHLKARWALAEFREHWREGIDAICRDSFCLGDGPVRDGYGKPWRASFKWFVANDDNWCSRWEREITEGVRHKRTREQIEADELARQRRIEAEEANKRGDMTPAGRRYADELMERVKKGNDEGSE